MNRNILLFISCLCFTSLSGAKSWSQDQVVVAASAYLPPYVIPADNTGIQMEILKQAFKQQGISNIVVRYMSNKRAELELKNGNVDVALNLPSSSPEHIYQSDSLISYQNVAISLASKNYIIETIKGLSGKNVLAFQNAAGFLDAPFEEAKQAFSSYNEVVNQEAQVQHLMKNWVDVIILERRIFLYYLNQYEKSNPVFPYQIHPIFSQAPRPAFFNNEKLKNLFNKGLASLVKSGKYRTIMIYNGTDYSNLDIHKF
ncbi:hypothetical protein PSECIP111951_00273 [Pseudoalteromonas holothuriae]|uniref:Solute-binding protein family 3/N-terminal domain-containing protein n=1 Tax=Pseudoalteromonas holothuriae TaxID=2963714 RepID=A0A9W4R0J5_9GAMM|nr:MULTISPECIES: transporter substrate-binding domain-containing protein [unclassified Pseudoalteromonas]CAH9050826.1 hypothetical protein PSECIP111951_00273 [Pseudoalteromonas sp. CIP111951]CAH9061487.1 hypothetical protein PSECIP111854_02821 [Pseudoalteromonas sp. CIP111854]